MPQEVRTLMGKEAHDLVRDVFKEVKDLITPTMGAKGLMAVIHDPMGVPNLTDDGVTVARAIRNYRGFKLPVVTSAIEACHNTERQAYDGTTLTAQLLYEIYNYGYEQIYGENQRHPQDVVDEIQSFVAQVLERLQDERVEMTGDMVEAVATISTKMPAFGKRIAEAHQLSGDEMNIIVEHAQNDRGIAIEHTKGMTIDEGFFDESMRQNGTSFKNAKAALLKSDKMTQHMVSKFLQSIPKKDIDAGIPIIYFITPNFNPEAMRLLINASLQSNLRFQFVFLNGAGIEELYMDLAAITQGKVQDTSTGIKEYTYDMCGDIKQIEIDTNKTNMIGVNTGEERVKYYKKRLNDKKFNISEGERVLITKRLASLDNGLTKIKIGVPSLMEFSSYKSKFDDAIGSVKKAFEEGVVIGGGKALYNLRKEFGMKKEFKHIAYILEEPHTKILSNAGYEVPKYKLHRMGIDVTTGNKVEYMNKGIIDSYAAIKYALINATSIAIPYLKMYTLIKEETIK